MISGIIAEFNPFHNGHAYLLEQARKYSDGVIAVMSGNLVQRGDIAIYPKHIRAYSALKNGADIVIALPAGWSMSVAENFAFGGISLLKNTKVVDRVVFGCETASPSLLCETANIINSHDFTNVVKSFLSTGISYANARQKAVESFSQECSEILSSPNNILAVEYICAINKLNFTTEIFPVKRIGVGHDSNKTCNNFSSASNIRELIRKNCNYSDFVPSNLLSTMNESEFADISIIDASLMFKLRSLTLEEIKLLPDISEGIENRIFQAIKDAKSLNDLCMRVKTKRYTYSRIKRIILSACFSIDNSYLKKQPPYIQVLGINKKGEEILSHIIKKSDIPVVVSNREISKLEGFAKSVFEKEAHIDDLYGLSFKTYKKSGTAYTLPLVKVD